MDTANYLFLIGRALVYHVGLQEFSFDRALTNLVPRSLVDEAEGEIWPNPICIT